MLPNRTRAPAFPRLLRPRGARGTDHEGERDHRQREPHQQPEIVRIGHDGRLLHKHLLHQRAAGVGAEIEHRLAAECHGPKRRMTVRAQKQGLTGRP
jgi:hypothetical protein